MREPPVALLRQLLRYVPETGKLFWLPRDVSMFDATATKTAEQICRWWNGRFAGTEAFTAPGVENCRHGRILGTGHYAHRVAWALHTGEWPEHEVDHEDGDRANNRIGNLRPATHAVNMGNKKLYRSNKSGAHGVMERRGRWVAHIRVEGRRKHLGTFATKEGAVTARKAAESNFTKFHANHGRRA